MRTRLLAWTTIWLGRRLSLRVGLALLACAASATARGELEIVITRGVDQALPIAVVPFHWADTSGEAPPQDVSSIVRSDLVRSGYFSAMSEADMPQQPHEPSAVNFSDWRRLDTGHILIGHFRRNQHGKFEIDFRLLDTLNETQIVALRVPARPGQLRWAAHRIADIVFEALIGIKGAFATRIAYITVREELDRTLHSLHIADSDGHNSKVLLESTQPLLSPSWSPDGKKLAYVSFESKNSAVYVQDIYLGRRDRVSAVPGINSAPAFSPDGTRLAMTLSHEGNPDIHILFLESRILKRLTHHPAIDTEPTWSADGRTIAFTSDRGGGPQIYTMDVDGGAPRRLSFEGAYNARPSYSPDGKRLAMVHGSGQGYHIAVLELDSGYFNVLTNAWQDESPSFSPNGSMIMYATRGGNTAHLAAVSVDGRVQQQLRAQQGAVQEPAWGPFLGP